eukprot:CAMPEP_0174984696 /NCGR_PEP_ID=MMETSP0004_2-20121128/17882_1 /TAXON_ID=420556 /ORGANISM="Ochromonas sp., Strain CCMP1393" /LENGTH=116 /DNA_ID=CAMNT_0016237167 /DNA_START=89 /DNA_END=435 /DNA_ORIENTATION=+
MTLETAFSNCDLYLIPSTIPDAGRGVVAGRSFEDGERLEVSPTITMSDFSVQNSQLKQYAFNTEIEGTQMIVFGPGNIYNHHQHRNVEHFWAERSVIYPIYTDLPYTNFTPDVFAP